MSDYHKDQEPSYERTLQRPPAQIKALNEWLEGFCAQRGYAYVDYFTATVDPRGSFRRKCRMTGCIRTPRGTG